eukprot:IDg4902t1
MSKNGSLKVLFRQADLLRIEDGVTEQRHELQHNRAAAGAKPGVCRGIGTQKSTQCPCCGRALSSAEVNRPGQRPTFGTSSFGSPPNSPHCCRGGCCVQLAAAVLGHGRAAHLTALVRGRANLCRDTAALSSSSNSVQEWVPGTQVYSALQASSRC